MKTSVVLTITLLLVNNLCLGQNEVCPPKNISTNPFAPSNPTAPEASFINEFNWFQEAVNNVLFDIPLTNMSDYFSISSMLNPYNDDNALCHYLMEADLSELDVHPEDGWELLFINLGRYPDGTTYSSQNSNMPYIILYNKYRSIVRVFGNCKFVQTNFSEVSVTLGFDIVHAPYVSGLLRFNNGTDRTMDQTTDVASVTSYCILPTNHNEWFHVDFQVAYDPCNCLYDSRLQLVFTPIESSQIEIINDDFAEVNIHLRDGDGLNQENTIIPVGPRMITFYAMAENVEYARVVAEKYIVRMASEGYNIDWLNWVYSSLALLETVAYAETNVISGTEINAAAQYAMDKRNQWGFATSGVVADFTSDVEMTWGILPASSWSYDPGNYHYTLNLEQLMAFCQQHFPAAQSFSSSAIQTGTNENKFSITPSSAYSSSDVVLNTDAFGTSAAANLLNPGTYPIQENDPQFTEVNAQNYPVYNEVLGLFAVLEQPKLDIFHNVEIQEATPWVNTYCNLSPTCTCDGQNGSIQGPFVTERTTSSVNKNTYRFKLSEPLKIVYNPALNIEATDVKVSASLPLWGSTIDHAPDPIIVCTPNGTNLQEPSTFDCGPDYLNGVTHWIEISPTISGFNYSTVTNNLHESELLNNYNAGDETIKTFSYSSNSVELDNFNTQVFELKTSTSQVWRDYPRDWTQLPEQNPTDWSCWWQSPDNGYCGNYPNNVINGIINEKQSNTNREVSFYSPYAQGDLAEASLGFIDLLFEIPVQENSNSSLSVFQHVRYPLNYESQNEVTSEFAVGWSATSNPNSIGSYGLQQNAYYGEKNWTINDMNSTGGEYLNPPNSNPVIAPSAITFIEITGNQSKANEIDEVIFKSENNITVHGNVIIPSGFTLSLEDLIEETSSPTPPVSLTDLVNFCAGIGGNSYNANQRSTEIVTDRKAGQINQRDKSRNDTFYLYPNPTCDILSIRYVGLSELKTADVLSPVGTLVKTITASEFNSPNNISFDTSNLESGTYYARCSFSNGEIQMKSFVVVR